MRVILDGSIIPIYYISTDVRIYSCCYFRVEEKNNSKKEYQYLFYKNLSISLHPLLKKSMFPERQI
jgi:hypothetical protein